MGRLGGFRCFECNGKAQHAHHVVPVAHGGTRTVPLCYRCHEKAHERVLNLKEHSRRTKEGMARAKAQGKRVSGHNVKDLPRSEITDLRLKGLSLREIGVIVGAHHKTVWERLRKWGIK